VFYAYRSPVEIYLDIKLSKIANKVYYYKCYILNRYRTYALIKYMFYEFVIIQ